MPTSGAVGAADRAVEESWTPGVSMQAFIQAMHVLAAALAPRIVALVNPGDARRLLDVGGATGAYTIAFLRAATRMRATLFDVPKVIEMAREKMNAAGMRERVTLVAGDSIGIRCHRDTISHLSPRSSIRIRPPRT